MRLAGGRCDRTDFLDGDLAGPLRGIRAETERKILIFDEKDHSSNYNDHSSDFNKAQGLMCYLMTIRRAKNKKQIKKQKHK